MHGKFATIFSKLKSFYNNYQGDYDSEFSFMSEILTILCFSVIYHLYNKFMMSINCHMLTCALEFSISDIRNIL